MSEEFKTFFLCHAIGSSNVAQFNILQLKYNLAAMNFNVDMLLNALRYPTFPSTSFLLLRLTILFYIFFTSKKPFLLGKMICNSFSQLKTEGDNKDAYFIFVILN